MSGFRTVAEIGMGALIGIGGVFNTVYTMRHSKEFYGTFSEGAWFPPGRWFVDNVVLPNATVFTVLLIVFQLAVATTILTRGDLVAAGLVAGAAFACLAALASSPGGTGGNLVLAAIYVTLAVLR